MNTIKKFDYVIAVVLLLLLTGSMANAQNQSIKTLKIDDGTNSTTYNADALVDFQSSSKGLLFPRVALTATNSASPLSAFTAGMTVYNTATAGTAPNNVIPGYYYCDGTQWIRFTDKSTVWTLTGNSGTTAGTNFIGTTDNQDLIFKRNNIQSGWLNALNQNTAFGVGSLPQSANIYANTAFGYQALANTITNGNTAVGYLALNTNTSGSNNTAVGLYAMSGAVGAGSNTAYGGSTLQVTTGSGNTAMGMSSLMQLVGGSYNIALGSSAGLNQTSGSGNIVIGYNQQLASLTGSNQLNIGGALFGTGLTGSASAPAGNIGINKTAPGNTLEVNQGTAGNSGLRFTQLTSASTGAAATTTSAQTLTVNSAGDVVMSNGLSYVNTQSGTSYTIATTDNQAMIYTTGSSAITITVPNTLPAGFTCAVIQGGTGAITFTGTGLQNAYSQYKTPNQYASVTIQTPATGTNILSGGTSW